MTSLTPQPTASAVAALQPQPWVMQQHNQASVAMTLLQLPAVKKLALLAALLPVVACWGSCMLAASEAAWCRLEASAKRSKACCGGRQPPLQHWQQIVEALQAETHAASA
jgi:hypothetical protein